MKNSWHVNLFPQIASFLLIILFVYTATSKIVDHAFFKAVLSKFPLIGNFSGAVSILLPATEYLTAALLLIPRFSRKGLLVSFILMSTFTFFLGYMILFVKDLPCSCGGVLNNLTWQQHLIFNMAFMAVSFWGWVFTNYEHKAFYCNKQG